MPSFTEPEALILKILTLAAPPERTPLAEWADRHRSAIERSQRLADCLAPPRLSCRMAARSVMQETAQEFILPYLW